VVAVNEALDVGDARRGHPVKTFGSERACSRATVTARPGLLVARHIAGSLHGVRARRAASSVRLVVQSWIVRALAIVLIPASARRTVTVARRWRNDHVVAADPVQERADVLALGAASPERNATP